MSYLNYREFLVCDPASLLKYRETASSGCRLLEQVWAPHPRCTLRQHRDMNFVIIIFFKEASWAEFVICK